MINGRILGNRQRRSSSRGATGRDRVEEGGSGREKKKRKEVANGGEQRKGESVFDVSRFAGGFPPGCQRLSCLESTTVDPYGMDIVHAPRDNRIHGGGGVA